MMMQRRQTCLATLRVLRGGCHGGPEGLHKRGGLATKEAQASRGDHRQARALRDDGDRLYRSGEYGKAVEAYTKALAADSSVEGAYGGRAAALLMSAQYGAALHDAIRAVAVADASDAREAPRDGDVCSTSQARGASSANEGAADRIHAWLLLGKTLLALGRGEEASVQFGKALASTTESPTKTDSSRQGLLQCQREARQGIKHARTYESAVRKAFNNMHLTRDMFYLPIVGRWRSWRKPGARSDDLDLPLGSSCLVVVRASCLVVVRVAHLEPCLLCSCAL
jgi:tetratricopeptide (TPR) repeat protein